MTITFAVRLTVPADQPDEREYIQRLLRQGGKAVESAMVYLLDRAEPEYLKYSVSYEPEEEDTK